MYETLYWRAGMTSHFAPVALLPFLGAFVVKQIRMAAERAPSVWVYGTCLVIPFFVMGRKFCGHPTTLVGLGSRSGHFRRMVVESPCTPNDPVDPVLDIGRRFGLIDRVGTGSRKFPAPGRYKIEFVGPGVGYLSFSDRVQIDSLQTIPLPILFSVVTPGLLFYLRHARYR